jgi:hypothetical protein
VTTPNGQSDFFAGFGVFPPPDQVVINTVAGTGIDGFNGDGIAATLAQLRNPISIAAVGRQSVCCGFLSRGADHATGIISTVTGTGLGLRGDGDPATAAALRPQDSHRCSGHLYCGLCQSTNTQSHCRRNISTIAGNGVEVSGDGGRLRPRRCLTIL